MILWSFNRMLWFALSMGPYRSLSLVATDDKIRIVDTTTGGGRRRPFLIHPGTEIEFLLEYEVVLKGGTYQGGSEVQFPEYKPQRPWWKLPRLGDDILPGEVWGAGHLPIKVS